MTPAPQDFENLSGELAVEGVVRLEDAAPAGAAIESANGRLWLAWTEPHPSYLAMMSSNDGYRFGGRQRLPYESTVASRKDTGGFHGSAPSLTVHDDVLLLAWPYATNQRRASERYPAIMWGNEHNVVLAGESKGHRVMRGVAVTSWRGAVVMGWHQPGMFGGLGLASTQGGVFGEPHKIDQGGPFRDVWEAPALCAVNDNLLVSWIGKKRQVRYQLNVVPFDGSQSGAPMEFPGVMGARMCDLNGEAVVAWRDLNALHVGFLRAGVLAPALRLPSGSRFSPGTHSPDICAHSGGLVLAWTDDGNKIHVARIRRT